MIKKIKDVTLLEMITICVREQKCKLVMPLLLLDENENDFLFIKDKKGKRIGCYIEKCLITKISKKGK